MKKQLLAISLCAFMLSFVAGEVSAALPQIDPGIAKQIEQQQATINDIKADATKDTLQINPNLFDLLKDLPSFSLVAPDPDEVTPDTTPTFRWTAVEPEGDTEYYAFIVSRIEAPGVTTDVFSFRIEKNVLKYTPTKAMIAGKYEWHMSAMSSSDKVLFKTTAQEFTVEDDSSESSVAGGTDSPDVIPTIDDEESATTTQQNKEDKETLMDSSGTDKEMMDKDTEDESKDEEVNEKNETKENVSEDFESKEESDDWTLWVFLGLGALTLIGGAYAIGRRKSVEGGADGGEGTNDETDNEGNTYDKMEELDSEEPLQK